ncbi:MAG TPA: hypothetical protein VHI52_09080, partial [Verrucomicrobiae bacterium]|nr:hypothetical protein [Verrucomicrobiae bacterium]
SSSVITIDNSTKNVGIGTTNPSGTLFVHGDIQSDSPGAHTSNLTLISSGSHPSLQFSRVGYNNWFMGSPDESANLGIAASSSSNYLLFLTSAGHVGISTTTPTTTLDVSGTLKIADGGEACDTSRLGAIKYTSGAFYVCQNTANGWEALGTASGTTTLALDDLTDVSTSTANGNLLAGPGVPQTLAGSSFTTAIGVQAMGSATGGGYNTAVGARALHDNTTGYDNTALGFNTLLYNTTGLANTALGHAPLQFNTTGYHNTAIGYTSGFYSNGQYNVMLGSGAGYGVSGSSIYNYSTFIGSQSGKAVTTGNGNTFLGYNAGQSVTTGSSNITIGYNTDTPSPTTSNYLNIGNTIYGDLSTDKIGIGTLGGANLSVSGSGSFTDRLGIGTSALPSVALDVWAAINSGIQVTADSSSGSQLTIRGRTNTNNRVYIGYNTASDYGRITALTEGLTYRPLVLFGSYIGIKTTSPTADLDVSGTLKIADGGEACDTSRLGAIKYTSGAFYLCQSAANGWQTLASISDTTGAGATDRIVSGSTQMVAYPNNTISASVSNPGGAFVISLRNIDGSDTSGTRTSLQLPVYNGTGGLYIESMGAATGGFNTGNYDGFIHTGQGTSYLHFSAGSQASGTVKQMTLAPSGNLGIGTTNPSQRLTVADTGDASISFRSGSGTPGPTREARITAVSTGGGGNGHNLAFLTNVSGGSPTEYVRITSDGNVGIATTTPSATLDVSGSIMGQTLQVTGGDTDTCGTSDIGKIRLHDGHLQMCKGG